MKNPLPKLLALLAFAAMSAAHPLPVAAQPQPVAPIAPAALEIQISSSQQQGKAYPSLGIRRPAVLYLIIRNISSKPVQLLDERNSWGFNNIHLEITMTDLKTLPNPIKVAKGEPLVWRSNVFNTETLAPNQAIVREIRLHVPTAIAHPGTPPTQEEIDDDKPNPNNSMKGEYFFFPFSTYNGQLVTLKAVYEVPKEFKRGEVWTGRVESPLLTYVTNWGVEY